MTSERRISLHAPSQWDTVLAPEIASLFVLDAAIVAAQRIFCVILDPSSFEPGGTHYPPTLALLECMRKLRCHIHKHRMAEEAVADNIAQDATRDIPF